MLSAALIPFLLITNSFSIPTPRQSLPDLETVSSHSINLTRRSTISKDLTHEERKFNLEAGVLNTYAKYNAVVSPESLEKRSSAASLLLGAIPRDFGYYATISLGTPPVDFELIMDTGSADLVVLSAPCVTGCISDTPLYNPSNSNTSVLIAPEYHILYGTGSASGSLRSDVLNFAGMTVTNQRIGSVNSSVNVATTAGVSGVAGLAWSSLSGSYITPFLQTLWKQNSLPSPVFGFAFTSESSSNVTAGGVMNVGFTDPTLYQGSINYISSPSKVYWDIPLQEVSIRNVKLGISTPSAIIDTGSSNIYVPVAVADSIYASISNDSRAVGNGLYVYPCSLPINLVFQFGGASYEVGEQAFNLAPADNLGVMCYGAVNSIGPSSGRDLYIFGDAFLKNVYVAFRFDSPAVGFAPLSGSKTPGPIPIPQNVPTQSATTLQNAATSVPSGIGSVTLLPNITVYQKLQNAVFSQIALSLKNSAKLIGNFLLSKKVKH